MRISVGLSVAILGSHLCPDVALAKLGLIDPLVQKTNHIYCAMERTR